MINENQIKKLTLIEAIKFLSKYIKPYKSKFIMFYIGWLVDRILMLISPIMFAIMIDEIVYYKNVDTFMRISVVIVVISIFSCILYFLIYGYHHYLMNMYTFGIKRDVFIKMQSTNAIYMSNKNTGDIINIIQKYTAECMHFVIRNIIHTTNNIFTFLFYITYSFIIDWRFGLLMIILVPVAVLISRKYGEKIRNYSEEQKEYYGTYIGWLYEMLNGLKDIRLLKGKNLANKLFINNNKKLFHVNIKTGVLDLTANNIIEGTNLLIQLAIFSLAAYLSLKGSITIGSLTVIIAYFIGLKTSVFDLSKSYLDAQKRLSYIQRIYEFMNAPTEDNWPGKKELNITKGNVSFKNLKFNYEEDNNVINNFSLNITGGEHFALVGQSGCGKTTIAYTLIGFYDPQYGQIEIDGQKLKDCSLKSIRENIGIVQQDVLIFDGTIRENLLLGNTKATEEQIKFACQCAGIGEFIEKQENGIDTIIGKNGIGLSGGQKQRIAIARIYLKNPKIIIFDEATSSLDESTEKQIHEAWATLLKGRTSIVIAHRLSSVMLCNKVGIMEKGKVVEIGQPNKMIKESKIFRCLFDVKEVVAND